MPMKDHLQQRQSIHSSELLEMLRQTSWPRRQSPAPRQGRNGIKSLSLGWAAVKDGPGENKNTELTTMREPN